MVAILFVISGIAALAGVGAILLGVPNYEFGLGNTLIMSGSVGIVGALIVFGLAATVRELRRLGRLLDRPVRQPRPADPDAAARAAGRAAGSARPQPSPPGRRPPEYRPSPLLPPDRPATDFDRLRPSGVPGGREGGEPPVVDEVESVPLSPAGLGRPTPTPPPIPPAENRFERRSEPPPTPSMRAPQSARPQEPRRATRNIFDPNWSPGAAARAEPERSSPERAAPPQAEEPPTSRPSEAAPAGQTTPAQPTPVSILKSGVIDGMAYTLYTDGSIEAQLPSGVMRFASIDELREHLEKHS
jgi:hypothetical protein